MTVEQLIEALSEFPMHHEVLGVTEVTQTTYGVEIR